MSKQDAGQGTDAMRVESNKLVNVLKDIAVIQSECRELLNVWERGQQLATSLPSTCEIFAAAALRGDAKVDARWGQLAAIDLNAVYWPYVAHALFVHEQHRQRRALKITFEVELHEDKVILRPQELSNADGRTVFPTALQCTVDQEGFVLAIQGVVCTEGDPHNDTLTDLKDIFAYLTADSFFSVIENNDLGRAEDWMWEDAVSIPCDPHDRVEA